ncbi:hypothetical protein RD110_11505 [Rhodoferax koreense]|uniref:PsiF repeat-containing protein n=1 Tax=Rhodoferax koreensis TaxID=1842727 RepID=A0A1P8JVE1_9BURK|nr:hypothetical protein [Rhodoferax koreense]APW37746.1 hypothetical protein RD110_11505 [Rhodoferax koreense]
MRPTLAALMVCALLANAANAADAGVKKEKPAAAKTVKAKKPGGKAPKFIKGGEESTAERDRRLLRECKGRANAGACLGYTG